MVYVNIYLFFGLEIESIIEERIWKRIMGEEQPPAATTEAVQETKGRIRC